MNYFELAHDYVDDNLYAPSKSKFEREQKAVGRERSTKKKVNSTSKKEIKRTGKFLNANTSIYGLRFSVNNLREYTSSTSTWQHGLLGEMEEDQQFKKVQ